MPQQYVCHNCLRPKNHQCISELEAEQKSCYKGTYTDNRNFRDVIRARHRYRALDLESWASKPIVTLKRRGERYVQSMDVHIFHRSKH